MRLQSSLFCIMSKLTKNSSSFDSLCIPKESKLDSDEILKTCKIETPIGEMIAISDDDYLYVFQNVDSKKLQTTLKQLKNDTSKDLVIGESKILANLKKEMSLYFEGKLKEWTIPLKFIGTDFQKVINTYYIDEMKQYLLFLKFIRIKIKLKLF